MFCPNCGSQADDNAKFCTTCGAVLPVIEKPAQNAEPEDKSPFGAAYENPPQSDYAPPPPPPVVDNSPFGMAYENPPQNNYAPPPQYDQYRQPYAPYQPQYNQYPQQQQENDSNAVALVGFILSFFVAIAGLICSINGLKNANRLGGKRKGLAIAGIIISAVNMLLGFIMAVATPGYYAALFSYLYMAAL